MEIKNAKITGTMLGTEDHGVMSFWIHLDYGDSGSQGAGGYVLDEYDKALDKRVATRICGAVVAEVLRVVGVESWEQLKGKYIRVKADYNKVYAIGNLLKNEWMDFDSFFSKEI